MRILFVENHEVFAATVIAEFLAEADVTVVSSVAAAEAEVSVNEFDVALVDYDLDDAKGDAFVRRLRAAGSTMPVIAVSSHGAGNDALVHAGADAICRKMDFSNISRVLANVLRAQPVEQVVPSSTSNTPPSVRDEVEAHPVAGAWRSDFHAIVESFVRGDHALSVGLPGVEPVPAKTAEHIREYLADYGEKLVPLPPETWETSCAQWMGSHWDVIVDLWTSEGPSDMILLARVTESNGEYRISVESVYVP